MQRAAGPSLLPPQSQTPPCPRDAEGTTAALRPRVSGSGGDGGQIKPFLQTGLYLDLALRLLQAAAGSGSAARGFTSEGLQEEARKAKLLLGLFPSSDGSSPGRSLHDGLGGVGKKGGAGEEWGGGECTAGVLGPALGFTAWSSLQVPSGDVQPQPLVQESLGC